MTGKPDGQTIVVTGAAGNLGTKMLAALEKDPKVSKVIALDRALPKAAAGEVGEKTAWIEGDLTDPRDVRWVNCLKGADGVIHFAARNPFPDASWSDASVSFDMLANLLNAIDRQSGNIRFVYATSNHVMGGYKDEPLASRVAPGALTTALEPAPGTRWTHDGKKFGGSAYAVSKLMGERLCKATAVRPGSTLTSVAVRIGWCQPGENHPGTINTSGLPDAGMPTEGYDDRDLIWFRNMWLSNRDFEHLMLAALHASTTGWTSEAIVVNGMSQNKGMKWDIESTRRLIGYEPQDNAWDWL